MLYAAQLQRRHNVQNSSKHIRSLSFSFVVFVRSVLLELSVMYSYFCRICYTVTRLHSLTTRIHQLRPKTFYTLIMILLQIRCVRRKAATTTKMYFRCFQKGIKCWTNHAIGFFFRCYSGEIIVSCSLFLIYLMLEQINIISHPSQILLTESIK